MTDTQAAEELVKICDEIKALHNRLKKVVDSDLRCVGLKGLQTDLGRAYSQADYTRSRAVAKTKE